MKEEFNARMLRIHCMETDQWQGEPLYKAIVARCMELGIAGATVCRGLEGFGASARIYQPHLFSISSNLPVMVTIVDTEEQIQKLLPQVEEMLAGGLIAISKVDAIRYLRSEKNQVASN
jgi:PII-like signaling protein